MGVHPPSSRAGAAAAVTALLLCTSLAAEAASAAQASSILSASSAKWGAFATTGSSLVPTTSNPLVLPVPNTTGNNGRVDFHAFFSVVNPGTLRLTGANYSATASATDLVFSIDACSGQWTESTNQCSGQVTTVLATPASDLSSLTVPEAAGSTIRLRAALIQGTVPNKTTPTVTIGVKVTRSQVRAATVTGG
ncbi:hypothetical protein [Arthrobacter sp. OAP107]|uniref:hypothetical protein n=1 Tax=Arthrobacter sp. OAP107 TaxID=3156445 RepID=UPI003398C818